MKTHEVVIKMAFLVFKKWKCFVKWKTHEIFIFQCKGKMFSKNWIISVLLLEEWQSKFLSFCYILGPLDEQTPKFLLCTCFVKLGWKSKLCSSKLKYFWKLRKKTEKSNRNLSFWIRQKCEICAIVFCNKCLLNFDCQLKLLKLKSIR